MDTDRYGRIVARIFVDGEAVNAAQLRSGHA
jgi:endonuclease YncB( thermonuclease family)